MSDLRSVLQTERLIHTRDMDTLHFVKCFQIHMSRRPQLNTEALLQAAADSAATHVTFKLLGYSSQSDLASGLSGCLTARQADRS